MRSLCSTLMLLLASAAAAQQPTALHDPPAMIAEERAVTARAAPGVESPRDRRSYALGVDFGRQLRNKLIDVDPDVLGRGLKDALSDRSPSMTDNEIRAAISDLQAEMKRRIAESRRMGPDANQALGAAFLAANAKKDGVVLLPSGLQYKVLRAGHGKKPGIDDKVVCRYRGSLINGVEFDNHASDRPETFPVNGVIKGWSEALQLMPVGSKWQLFVPPQLAYGERGSGNQIGPNATLVFDVELVSIQDGHAG